MRTGDSVRIILFFFFLVWFSLYPPTYCTHTFVYWVLSVEGHFFFSVKMLEQLSFGYPKFSVRKTGIEISRPNATFKTDVLVKKKFKNSKKWPITMHNKILHWYIQIFQQEKHTRQCILDQNHQYQYKVFTTHLQSSKNC